MEIHDIVKRFLSKKLCVNRTLDATTVFVLRLDAVYVFAYVACGFLLMEEEEEKELLLDQEDQEELLSWDVSSWPFYPHGQLPTLLLRNSPVHRLR